MTASTLHLIPPVRRRMSCCDSCCHSRCNAASNWRMFCTGGSRACIRRSNMSQICSIGFKSGLLAGQGTEVTAVIALERWGLALSSIYTGLVAKGWLSNGGQQLAARRLWCTDHQLGCLVWWLNPAYSYERYSPKPLLKGQLAGCSLGYRLYLCVSKPSSGRRLHEAETGSRLTNGSCAISLNSNHVVLNTMPNVIVDVGLTTVDV